MCMVLLGDSRREKPKKLTCSLRLQNKAMKSEEDSDSFAVGGENVEAQIDKDEQEQALLLLIEHRTKEVERNKSRVSHFTNELERSEKKLEETKTQLSRLRGQHNIMSTKKPKGDVVTNAKVEQRLASPTHICSDSSQNSAMSSKNSQGDVKHEQRSSCNTYLQIREGSFRKKTQSRPQIILPAVNPIPFQPVTAHKGTKASNGSNSRPTESVPTHTNIILEPTGEKPITIFSELEALETQAKGTKRKFEQKEQKDLIPLIGRSSSAQTVHCQTCFFISSQHKRRLRGLVLCPTNDQLFVTSALDGIVNLWQVQARGSSANFLSSSDCTSVKQRRWPEDIAWHPHGNSLFSVYSADGGDSQVAVLDLNKAKERSHVNFLEGKPHVKGNINNIMFMPWEDNYFVTGGSDHAVVLWTEKDGDNKWKPKVLHRNLHSSAVMGVAGLQHKQIVVSAGADKRISGFDVLAGKADYRHQIESKCMSIIPNPFDVNLFMVQTGTPRRQLQLFDYRLRQTEIHAFGWEQESSESQSALINQAWSPDGLYITSGSADPVIHIFDIRYNSQQPTQSIRAHQKRVFKAVWHHVLPLLISISSDLNIGLHKIT